MGAGFWADWAWPGGRIFSPNGFPEERQRVAVARALYLKPKLLLADEPTASLDRRQAREVLALMRELSREVGAALLLSTHDEGLVEGFPVLRL